jgi:hypothetical protein
MNRSGHFVLKPLMVISLSACLVLSVYPMLAPASASSLKADEDVIIFPTAAHLDLESNSWVVPVHGWVFEPADDSIWRSVLVDELLEWLELRPDLKNKEIFRSRARMFLVDNERGKTFDLESAGLDFRTLPSSSNGHFRQALQINRKRAAIHLDGDWLSFEIDTETTGGRKFEGRVQLIPPKGLSVISDIDDTIKISSVLDREELLINTFLKKYQPVPGMPEVYRSWAKEGAVFHYVSGSPWQLYPFLTDFMSREGFPPGSFALRSFRIKDRTFFNLFASPEETKIPAIESIVTRFPGRRFILAGDSGERDPEVYGEVARNHLDQIVRIFIRDVTGGDVSIERLEKAFSGIGRDRWKVFRDAEELPGVIIEY